MQLASTARRLSRVFIPRQILFHSAASLNQHVSIAESSHNSHRQWKNGSSFSHAISLSGTMHILWQSITADDLQYIKQPLAYMAMTCRTCCTTALEQRPTEVVVEMHQKLLDYVNLQVDPPQSLLEKLLKSCDNRKDIELFFDILQKIQSFKMSKLQMDAIHDEIFFQDVLQRCAHVGATDFGSDILHQYDLRGLIPTIESANNLLRYALKQLDLKLMDDIMEIIKKNSLPLRSETLDIVVRLIHKTDNWRGFYKYYKMFVKADIHLKIIDFVKWMNFAVKKGDTKRLWKIEKLRAESVDKHNVGSGLACAKGFLIEREPEDAAAVIRAMMERLSDRQREQLVHRFRWMVTEWPLNFIRFRNEEDQKAVAGGFRADIPAMVKNLSGTDLVQYIDMQRYTQLGDSLKHIELGSSTVVGDAAAAAYIPTKKTDV